MSEYRVTHLDEIDETNDGRCPWRPVRHHFGVTSFGVNAWTAPEAGDRVINEHDEADEQEELYLVQRGRARFELDGESVDAPAGTFVYAEPGVKRTAFAEEAGTTVVVMGGTPGQAYEVSGWEVWVPFHGLYEDGKYAEAADASREAVESANSRDAAVQPRLHRSTRGAEGRRDEAPSGRVRGVAVRAARGRPPGRTPISIRSAASRGSRRWSKEESEAQRGSVV